MYSYKILSYGESQELQKVKFIMRAQDLNKKYLHPTNSLLASHIPYCWWAARLRWSFKNILSPVHRKYICSRLSSKKHFKNFNMVSFRVGVVTLQFGSVYAREWHLRSVEMVVMLTYNSKFSYFPLLECVCRAFCLLVVNPNKKNHE